LLDKGAIAVLFDPHDTDPSNVPYARLSAVAGRACLRMMDLGVALCRSGLLEGFAFAPFNKTSLKMGGNDLSSELEYLARACGVTRGYCEINVLDGIWSTRVTSHIPISEVSHHITEDAVLEAIEIANGTALRTGLSPRIGVAALNPHAGENGHCGREEIESITPAIERAQTAGITVSGPWPADTVFVRAYAGQFDAIVTMYHDQGQIALKMRGFERGAAVDGGFPTRSRPVRTGRRLRLPVRGKPGPPHSRMRSGSFVIWRYMRVADLLRWAAKSVVWIVTWSVIASIVGFAAMGMDKRKARTGRWRIPERTLLLWAAIGGAAGVWAGMRVFHHKTRHKQFLILVPFFLLMQLLLLAVLAFVS
jgi:4-hydroxy-L-threonine phosphate dehydrogenase PdxA/uncharacterized membrane protein YsdA (DUF1294 family)